MKLNSCKYEVRVVDALKGGVVPRDLPSVVYTAAFNFVFGTNYEEKDLWSKSRKEVDVLFRQLYYYYLYKSGECKSDISKKFGKTYATIIHSLRVVESRCMFNKSFRIKKKKIDNLLRRKGVFVV